MVPHNRRLCRCGHQEGKGPELDERRRNRVDDGERANRQFMTVSTSMGIVLRPARIGAAPVLCDARCVMRRGHAEVDRTVEARTRRHEGDER